MSTCAFTVCVSVKTGVKITVNFYVKIDVNFTVKTVNFYTVNFYSVNFRAVIFYDFSAFWGWKCWRIFLAVLDNGGAAHSGLLGNLGIRGFRMLGKVCEHFILLHLTGSLSVLTGALRSLAHAVSLAHCVDCRDVLVELPVRDGVDAILADDKIPAGRGAGTGAKAPCPGFAKKKEGMGQMYSKDAGKDQMLMTMERALTSGQKAGFFFLGFLGGIVGILAASLMNINAPYRPEGTKMAALGFATACVLGTLIALVGFIALLGAR